MACESGSLELALIEISHKISNPTIFKSVYLPAVITNCNSSVICRDYEFGGIFDWIFFILFPFHTISIECKIYDMTSNFESLRINMKLICSGKRVPLIGNRICTRRIQRIPIENLCYWASRVNHSSMFFVSCRKSQAHKNLCISAMSELELT